MQTSNIMDLSNQEIFDENQKQVIPFENSNLYQKSIYLIKFFSVLGEESVRKKKDITSKK